uniref:Uncharacterized protein n=1 Tax=Picea glauca TaxID=3330 RepID=A0A117NG64_PICGL|nr:hypothetical protein ABT39_MTgene1816 [Picea glauca]QHR91829.1 hypothetical protein Q903MT_gene5865 [Picea sitchensis]
MEEGRAPQVPLLDLTVGVPLFRSLSTNDLFQPAPLRSQPCSDTFLSHIESARRSMPLTKRAVDRYPFLSFGLVNRD